MHFRIRLAGACAAPGVRTCCRNDLLRCTLGCSGSAVSSREEEGTTATDPRPPPSCFSALPVSLFSLFFLWKNSCHIFFSNLSLFFYLTCTICQRALILTSSPFEQTYLSVAKNLLATSLNCTHSDKLKWSSDCFPPSRVWTVVLAVGSR